MICRSNFYGCDYDEHVHCELGRFALTTEGLEFASEPTTFQEAWNQEKI